MDSFNRVTQKNPFEIYDSTQRSFDLTHGFLPAEDPLFSLPSFFQPLESLTQQLPKLLMAGQIRKAIERMPIFDTHQLKNGSELERAMMLFSYLGHAYVWGEAKVVESIPPTLAIPWYEVAVKINRPPVLSYASYALYNWRRLDAQRPIALGNIALLQNFLGGIDEEWFVLVHVEIEAKAVEGLLAILAAQQYVHEMNASKLILCLQKMQHALHNMCEVLDRMPEHCDPYIYYRRVRPYLYGWKNNPVLPEGLIYEGVKPYNNQPQKFKGETGAQSSIVPVFDAILGIEHEENALKAHLMEMRDYMPPNHLAFLTHIEQQGSIRGYVKQHHDKYPELKEYYNGCITLLGRFRQTHVKYAAQYIQQQSQTSKANSTEIGTGGTPFMSYLRHHLHTTDKFLL